MKRIVIIMSLLLIASVAMATPILQQLPIKVHGDTLFWNATGTPPYQWGDTLIGTGGIVVLDSFLNNINDTFRILHGDSLFVTFVNGDSITGHLWGIAESLGTLPASSYLNNVLDTFGILRGDSLKVIILQPMIANTGYIGITSNAFDHAAIDSVFLTDSLFAWKTSGNKRNLVADSIYNGVIFGGPDKTYDITFNSGSTFNILQNGNLSWSGATAARAITYNSINKISLTESGASIVSDTISGYNGNIWAVNSWGITITGVDTLSKFYMSSFDSTKFVRVWGTIKSVSSGGNPDTLVYKDSLRTDSIKITIPVGALWLAPSLISKKWPTNPGGVLNPVYCIFRKGATTAAANMQFFTSYGMAKGRVF